MALESDFSAGAGCCLQWSILSVYDLSVEVLLGRGMEIDWVWVGLRIDCKRLYGMLGEGRVTG